MKDQEKQIKRKFPKALQIILDKKASSDNTIDLNAYANGLLDCYSELAKSNYTEKEVIELLKKINLVFGFATSNELYDWFEQNKNK